MTQARYFIAIVIAALAVQLGLAQDTSKKQPHYKLVELDTFGGPNSFAPIVTCEINGMVGAHAINNRGTVAGYGVLTNGNTHDFVLNPLRGGGMCRDIAEETTLFPAASLITPVLTPAPEGRPAAPGF